MSIKGHHTGMAGEFAVMERLHRLGHLPALTLGNAKTVDIMCKSPKGKLHQISVKAIQGGGKWGIGSGDYTAETNLVFVLLLYRKFDKLETAPEVWVVPSDAAMRLRKPWLNGAFAIYCGNEADRDLIADYKDAWKYLADDESAEATLAVASAETPARPSPKTIAQGGGVLVRSLVAIGGFRAKFGKWPTVLTLSAGSISNLRNGHLTPEGFALLESKLRIVEGKDESVYAIGDDGQVFDYGAETVEGNVWQPAQEWAGLKD